MDETVCSKKEFVEWITEGFPIDIAKDNISNMLELFTSYVNECNNYFDAVLITDDKDEESVMIKVYDVPLAIVKYNLDVKKIIIVTGITGENADVYSREFNEYEVKHFLGEACMGVIIFFKNYKEMEESFKFLSKDNDNTTTKDVEYSGKGIINKISDASNEKPLMSENKKYKPWLLK